MPLVPTMLQMVENAGRELVQQSPQILTMGGSAHGDEHKSATEVFKTCGDILKDWEKTLGWGTSPTPERLDGQEEESRRKEEEASKGKERTTPVRTYDKDKMEEVKGGNAAPEPATHLSGREKEAHTGNAQDDRNRKQELEIPGVGEYLDNGTTWTEENGEGNKARNPKDGGMRLQGKELGGREEDCQPSRVMEEPEMEWEEDDQIRLASLHRLGKREKQGTMELGKKLDISTEEDEVVRPIRRKSKS